MKKKRVALRTYAWRVKTALILGAKSLLPSWTKYADYRSVHDVREAWPPLRAVAPAPVVYWPNERERAWFAKNWYFADLPIVLPPVLLHEIPDGLLFPDTGTLATSDGWLIEESCPYRLVYSQSAAFNRLKVRRARSMGDELITSILIGRLGTSFGHWIVDALPRLWALSLVDEQVVLLVPDTLRGVKRRLVELAVSPNVEIREVRGRAPVRSRRVLLAPFTTTAGCGLMRPEVADFLRGMVPRAERLVPASFAPPRQIYISREKAQWSMVANEPELKAELARLGVVSVVAEDLSIEEQIVLFSRAELVVGALGSGLLNCLFQPRGATLIEVFAGGLEPDTHAPSLSAAGIAITVGLDYVPIYHRHRDPEPSYTVDTARICQVVADVQSRSRLKSLDPPDPVAVTR